MLVVVGSTIGFLATFIANLGVAALRRGERTGPGCSLNHSISVC